MFFFCLIFVSVVCYFLAFLSVNPLLLAGSNGPPHGPTKERRERRKRERNGVGGRRIRERIRGEGQVVIYRNAEVGAVEVWFCP